MSVNIGRKIERVRTIKGMKQETLSARLGLSQGTISKIEQSDEIDDEKLNQIAQVLGVTPDTIKNFDEDVAVNNIQYNHDSANGSQVTYQFNPLEKIEELYERMLESERSRVKALEEIIANLTGKSKK